MLAAAVVGIGILTMRDDNIGGFVNRFVAYVRSALLLSACAFSFLALPAAAHDRYHAEFYSRWVTRDGISCCNAKDCQPIDDANVRVRNQAVEVYVEGEWVPVAPEKIRPYEAPDMHSHVCHMGRIIFCFVFGGGA
jgi:hypothetical protein